MCVCIVCMHLKGTRLIIAARCLLLAVALAALAAALALATALAAALDAAIPVGHLHILCM